MKKIHETQTSYLRYAHEFLFSLNIALVAKLQGNQKPNRFFFWVDTGESSLQSKLNSHLHLHPHSPIGANLAFVVLALGMALCLFLLLRVLSSTVLVGRFLRSAAGIVSLLFLPVSWLCVTQLIPVLPPLPNPPHTLLVLELLAVSAFAVGDRDGGPGGTGGPGTNGKSWRRVLGNRGQRTFMPAVPGSPGDPIWGTEAGAINNITAAISPDIEVHRIYAITAPLSATIHYFNLVNGVNPMDILGFIGHATLAAVPNTQPPQSIATGLVFVDNALIRTPDCTASGNILGVCYDLDQTKTNAPCNAGMIAIPSYDGTQTGCYYLTQPNGQVAETTRVLLTSAKIVFVAACDTGRTFLGWWDMNLNAVPGGRALVAPDIAAMSALPINQTLLQTVSPGAIDLKQGAIAWEALVKSLAAGNNIQKATDDANTAVANFYGSNPRDNAQVIFKVEGNPNVCPRCKPPQ